MYVYIYIYTNKYHCIVHVKKGEVNLSGKGMCHFCIFKRIVNMLFIYLRVGMHTGFCHGAFLIRYIRSGCFFSYPSG